MSQSNLENQFLRSGGKNIYKTIIALCPTLISFGFDHEDMRKMGARPYGDLRLHAAANYTPVLKEFGFDTVLITVVLANQAGLEILKKLRAAPPEKINSPKSCLEFIYYWMIGDQRGHLLCSPPQTPPNRQGKRKRDVPNNALNDLNSALKTTAPPNQPFLPSMSIHPDLVRGFVPDPLALFGHPHQLVALSQQTADSPPSNHLDLPFRPRSAGFKNVINPHRLFMAAQSPA